MKKLPIILSAAFLAATATVASFTIANAANTSSDPLVTLSYVEEVLAPRLKSELTTYIQNNYSGQSSGNASENANYTVVHMTKGQVLYAKSPTEVILRAGLANAVTPFMDQGVCDMTSGVDLYSDEPLPRYHYCLIPRGDDGRGVVAVSDEIYIMVRGEFEIRE